MSASELSRLVRLRKLPAQPLAIEASAEERAALATRFGLAAVHELRAKIALEQRGEVLLATGDLYARIDQFCAVSGERFPVEIEERITLRFVPEGPAPDGEIEIELLADDPDEIEYTGDAIDIGEAVAQSLGLAIDPYAEGPNAEDARKAAGIKGDDAPSGPLAEALAALKRRPD